jgi:phosphoribosylglycinamide formyltransferase-1
MIALAGAINDGRIPDAEISVVVSDQGDAAGVASARERGLNAVVIERKGRSREDHDGEIVASLHAHHVEIVCLAGYMRLLSRSFLDAYQNRILNIHPSLLPAFPGLGAQRQAIAHGVKWSGCTVHFVDETLDGGAIIAQQIVPVLSDDTEETLAARILHEEHLLYAEAVALVLSSDYQLVGRRVLPGRKENSQSATQ